MKKFFSSLLLIVVIISMLFMTACAGDVQDIIDNNTKTPLSAPTNLRIEGTTLLWNGVEYASGYTVLINDATYTTATTSYSLQALRSGDYVISVKANGDGVLYTSSAYSNTITYTRETSSGNEYSDDVIAAFREFDEINTKNSFLGYGIDIINASAITSKNVLMTYPIFDIELLMSENLLKSNEHYNSFESIEASTIVEFSQNMSTSSSITAGANVSAKGNIYGVDVSASASLSSGLTTSFTKTSDLVESQYFLEIIAENQSYWLILQTSEQRYKELLSDEFRSDLYNVSITPAQLFAKYGTHMLTSVAMGGNICMYYTMYSYDKNVKTSSYAEVSSKLKTNVEAAYGGYSAGTGTENSFNSAFTYQELAHSYGINIDKKIISAGGGSFGINNETTLYANYHDWQKSLDTYPVVIGIKDTNSLYPIWNLIDLNVDGAQERYTELYNYFQQYGAASYNNLCETYSITPSVAPTAIENITVGGHTNYAENQIVNVKSGDTLQITFDVAPHNANKYLKTFSVDNTSLATVDDTGLLTISPTAPGGSYIKVAITAGSISRQITLYVINTYNVTFNTRVAGLEIPAIYGILEGYTIDEPQIKREGYTLEGWYRDAANTDRFDFESDSVTSHMTLYAKWVAIKPVVTFETGEGSEITPVTLAYNQPVSKPKSPTLSGYVFGGWFADEECTEAFDFNTLIIADITLYAKWDIIEYTVNFVTNGGTPIAPVTTSIKYSYKIAEPITTRQYYTLDGWYKDEYFTQKFYFETEITADTTLYAKWTAEKASVRFVDTDGTSAVYDEFGAPITARTTDIENEFKIVAPTPYKEGYTFVGWSLDGIMIDTESYAGFKPNNNGYTLSARWSINKYTITFDTNGANEIKPITQDYGTSIKAPANPIKEGYTFDGWDTEIPATMPARDITITAKWTINKYTITFDTNGGTEIAPITQDYGTAIVAPANPTKEGCTFSGWDKIIPTTMPAENIIINAIWNAKGYTITFNANGGTEIAPITQGYGTAIVAPANPTRAGYTFSGWDKAIPSTMPADNVTITAKWTINQYTITFDTNGGAEIAPITQDYGTAIIAPANPTKEGCTFSGWDKVIPTTMPAEDMTIEAKWTINQYTITFDTNGGSEIKPITQDYGTSITSPADPTRAGYHFGGWKVEIPTTMPAKDMTIEAKWTINQYTITFDTNGGSKIEPITQDYGTSITSPADPTRAGYHFGGWKVEIPTTMPAEDITIEANEWILYSSDIEYILNSETTAKGQATKGSFSIYENSALGDISSVSYLVSQINYAAAVTYSEYYNFLGWYTEASGGIKLTDSKGILLANVSGYTNAEGKWIRESFDKITLYAHWEQTETDYTYLQSYEDLVAISSNPSGKYLVIDDIDVELNGWTPIDVFSGELQGNGKSIYNFSLSASGGKGTAIFAFIKTLSSEGLIENLTIGNKNSSNYDNKYSVKYNISYTESSSISYLTVGAFVGDNNGTIKNCQLNNVYMDISFIDNDNNENLYLYVGGIAAQNYGTIINSSVSDSTIKAKAKCPKESGDENKVWLGGVCGRNFETITSCNVKTSVLYALVEGDSSDNDKSYPWGALGGIVGEQLKSTSSTNACSVCDETVNNMTISNDGGNDPVLKKDTICGLKTGGTIN